MGGKLCTTPLTSHPPACTPSGEAPRRPLLLESPRWGGVSAANAAFPLPCRPAVVFTTVTGQSSETASERQSPSPARDVQFARA